MRQLCLMAKARAGERANHKLGAAVVPIRVRRHVVDIKREQTVDDTVSDLATRRENRGVVRPSSP